MRDAAAAIIWFLTCGLLITTAFRLSRRLFPADQMGPMIAHIIVLCWACIAAIAIALGSMGLLSPVALLAGVCACCVVVRIMLWNTNRPHHELDSHVPPHRLWAVAWGVLGSLLGAHVVLNGILSFPKDWDTLAYHLPLIDHWIREARLYVPECAFWYCPGNSEILGLWFVAPFSGDFLIAANNLPAITLMIVVAIQFADALGIARTLCHLTGMAVLATEPTWRQAVSAENDVAVTALFLATLFYIVRYSRNGARGDLLLASAGAGLLSGTKYYALGYAGVAAMGVIILHVGCGRPRDAGRTLTVGLVGVRALGVYWYLRNAVATGAPLYPRGFTEATNLWHVIRPESHTSSLLRSGRTEVWPLYMEAVHNAANIHHVVAVALLPLTVVWLGVSGIWNRRQSILARQPRVWLAVVIALSGLVGVMTPNVVETAPGTMNMLQSRYHSVRLTLPFLSVCVVGLAVPLSDVVSALAGQRQPLRRTTSRAGADAGRRRVLAVVGRILSWLILGTIAAAVAYEAARHIDKNLNVDLLLTALNLFLLSALLISAYPLVCGRRRMVVAATILILAGAAWTCERLAARWHLGFSAAYNKQMYTNAFTRLERVDALGERICIADNCYYPFFGSRRQYDVCRPLFLPDYQAFLQYLQRQRVTLVVTCNTDTNSHRRYVHVADWIAQHAEVFQTTDKDRHYTWARVIRRDGEGEEGQTLAASPPNRGDMR